MKDWKIATILPGETANVMFTAIITSNDNATEYVSFGSSALRVSAENTMLIQSLVTEIMDVMSIKEVVNDGNT